jgi:hypothetical protein
MSHSFNGEELMVFCGPELDEDLAALLMLDEYAVAHDVDAAQWTAAATPRSPPPGTPSDSDESMATTTPVSPAPSNEDAETRGSDSDSSNAIVARASQADDEQRRRRRHRESMARYRQERRTRVDTMKDQESKLQKILLQMLAHNKHIAGTATTRPQQFRAQFTELVRARESLLLEKQELVGKLSIHDQRARAMQSISEQVFGKSMFVFPRTPGGVWLRYDEDESPFYYEPIKEELCRKTIALGLKKMAELLRTLPRTQLPQPSVVSTSNLLGWNTERAFTQNERGDPVMLFRFSRRVSRNLATLDGMLERAWKIYTSPDVMSQSSASSVRTQLVQQVHEDIVILIRNAPEKKAAGRSRYLGLYHKMRTGDEPDADPRMGRCAMIFTMLMNRSPREDDEISSSVHNSGSWLKDGCALMRFTEKPVTPSNRDPGIDVEYMGYVECLNPQHGEHMWTELCLLMLLWEHAVVPRQLLAM